MALRLRRRGVVRVRPLAGGFDAWREKGYALHGREGAQGAARQETPDAGR